MEATDIFIVNHADEVTSAVFFNNAFANEKYNTWNKELSESFNGCP
jgi:hypothetical protein